MTDQCALSPEDCVLEVNGTGMEARVRTFCQDQVDCAVELEQHFDGTCGTLNYIQVTYTCIVEGIY